MASNATPAAETIEPNAAAAESRGAAGNAAPGEATRPPDGRFFTVDPIFLGGARLKPYERERDDPLYRPLRIYTLDPTASRLEGAVATVNVPYEPLRPGPAGSVLEVMDWDETAGESYPPADLDERNVLIGNGRNPSLSDMRFHQQMVYAVCATTYNVFRLALGRDVSWGFAPRPGARGAVLRVLPHAFEGENAYYDPDAGELKFGYFNASAATGNRDLPRGRVFTCLSHDIIVHETTHALLDGMRARFRLPSNPDVLAFHEGFADLIALLAHFSYHEVVRAAIERSGGLPETDALLLSVARQFGRTTGRKGPLRTALDGGSRTSYDKAGTEPHDLGSVLVSAVFEAFAAVFRRKTAIYRRLGRHAAGAAPSPDLASLLAKEASQLATQFLSICVRAIDYCPPVDLCFGEYLRAMLTADFDLVPDDPHAYREALIEAFARRRIYPRDVLNLSEDVLLWEPPPHPQPPPIEALHFKELRFAGDPGRTVDEAELRRQAEAVGAYVMRPGYAALFGCAMPGDPALGGDLVEPAVVGSVRSLRRVGPDSQVGFGLVAEVVQRRWVADPDGGPPMEFHGGSTLLLDPGGNLRYLIRKSVLNRQRMERQRHHLAPAGRAALWEERGGRRHLPATALRHLHETQRLPRRGKDQASR